MRNLRSFFAASAVLLTTAFASAEPWNLDPAHSHVGFSVRHMMISDVQGQFHDVKAQIDLDDKDLTKSSVMLTIAAASIDTGVADRDKHLKSPDFFDAAKFPNLTFKSSKIVKAGKKYKVTGDLTIRDVTKPVTLDVTISDAVTSPWGKQVRAVKVEGKVNRHDFGLNWNKALDKGGVLVGDDVTFDINCELNK
jgi:polyisoprenoid-binding protein YceI